MGMRKISFTEVNPGLLAHCKICPKGHCQPDGTNVKHKVAGCLACRCGISPGPYSHQFENIGDESLLSDEEKATLEHHRAKHIRVVMEWNARNTDKTKEYVKTYLSNPEVKEHKSKKARDAYYANVELRRAKRREDYRKKHGLDTSNIPPNETPYARTKRILEELTLLAQLKDKND